jgi:beta-N-acetylhexosaminidase
MTLEQKIGQCVVVGMSGTVITNDLREAISRYHCGGVRLSPFYRIFRYFSDDQAKQQELGEDYVPSLEKMARQGEPPYASPEQFTATLNELRELAAQRNPSVPLHMVIDQEGDTSKDYSRGGVAQFPSNMGLAAGGDPEAAYDVARAIGRQMKGAGLDMIHSPVVDVNINPLNPEIGRRSFSDDPAIVAEYAAAMVRGFKDAGIIAAAKHFPGRGDSATDAHHACPVLDVDRERLHRVELAPYRQLISAGLDAVMMAHCIYPALDGDTISTVSRRIITGLLREELGFEGLITTDSMTMGALIDRYGVGESCARALAAGADVVLMKAENQWRGEMFYTIRKWLEEGKISEQELDGKLRRILGLKYDYGLFETMGMADPLKAADSFSEPFVMETEKRSARNAILVVKDELGALPLDTREEGARILLINQLNSVKSPNDLRDHPALFQELLERELPKLQTFEVAFGGSEEEDRAVTEYVRARSFDLIIATNFYDRSSAVHSYATELIEAGYPLLLITNTPYCIKESGGLLTAAPSSLLNMNLTPEGLRTAVEVLFGRLEPRGRWPLANYDPFGLYAGAKEGRQ